jgi:hypothetical protein
MTDTSWISWDTHLLLFPALTISTAKQRAATNARRVQQRKGAGFASCTLCTATATAATAACRHKGETPPEVPPAGGLEPSVVFHVGGPGDGIRIGEALGGGPLVKFDPRKGNQLGWSGHSLLYTISSQAKHIRLPHA